MEYDATGKKIAETDPSNRTTQFKYILRETAAYLLYRATGESVAGAPGIG